ncbi:MAG: VanW family protein [Chloroflexota bacterium]|mgnify:CR=1 FL=1
MTSASDAQPIADTPLVNTRFSNRRWPVLAAFLFGLVAVFALSAGALLAFEAQYQGRVLPGVRVGSIDLAGLSPDQAAARLSQGLAGYADGELVLAAGDVTDTIAYAEFARRANVDAIVVRAMAVGRDGNPVDRLIGDLRTAFRGIVLEPEVTYDVIALERAIGAFAAPLERTPVNATVTRTGNAFTLGHGAAGQVADPASALAAAIVTLDRLDAPKRLDIVVPLRVVEPAISTSEAIAARAQAERIAQAITLVDGEDSWSIPQETVVGWLAFVTTPEGELEPVIGTPGVTGALSELAPGMAREPVSATFLFAKGGGVVGVQAGADGRQLDVDGTALLVADTLRSRAAGTDPGNIAPAFTITKPTLSTEEAEKTAPLMKKLSSWTTYFPIGEKNGFGANIWIPARDIDGYVVAPGAWFDFWAAVGPITRERGYRDGGAIINGKTEPQGALAGGICSCSTTLFNTALRAGLEMGARRNHYYYIDRYPIGLDATVFKSSSGSVQTMSFRNDTGSAILIRGFEIKNGSKGYVRFDLYGVPDGRTVSFSTPIIKDVRKASDSTVYTDALPAGTRKRIEYPVDGKKVWVTRTVRDANGAIIHQETYYSNYARITGIVQVGTGGSTPAPAPAPIPAPTPPPETSPAP